MPLTSVNWEHVVNECLLSLSNMLGTVLGEKTTRAYTHCLLGEVSMQTSQGLLQEGLKGGLLEEASTDIT